MNSTECQIFFFTDLAQNARDVQTLPLSSFSRNLESRALDILEGRFPETPVYEFLGENQRWSKFYYDLDIKDRDFPGDAQFWIQNISQCLSIPETQVVSICQTPWTDEYPKTSLHITLGIKGTRSEIKNSAIKLRRFLQARFPTFCEDWIDLKVYGKSQKWRCAASSKRNQYRYKMPLLGSITDSLISAIDGLPCFPVQRPSENPSTPRFRWLDHALQRVELSNLWEQKRASYGMDGFLIGGSLYLDAKNNPALLPEAKRLFRLFCGKEQLADSDQFEHRFAGFNKEQWNKIHKWVKDFHAGVAKLLEPLWSGAVVRIFASVNTTIPEDITDSELEAVVAPRFETKMEYIISQHVTRSSKMRNFWELKLRDNEIGLLEVLLRHDNLSAYKKALKSCYDNFGMVGSTRLPFGYLKLDHSSFKEWFVAYFDYPGKLEDCEVEDELVHSVWNDYCLVCKDLDNDLFVAIQKEASGVHMLAPKEQSNPTDLIRAICLNESKYEMQYPYAPFFQALFLSCGGVNDLFWIALSKYNQEFLECEKRFHFLTQPFDDDAAAKIILQIYPFWRRSASGELYVYDDAEGYWSSDEGIQKGVISRLVSFLEQSTEKSSRNWAGSTNLKTGVYQCLKISESLRIHSSSDFRTHQQSGFNRLLFRNGYYDAIEEKFHAKMTVDIFDRSEKFFCHPHIMFFSRIDNDYKDLERCDTHMYQEMLQTLIYDSHGKENGDFWLQFHALALMGHRKKFEMENIGDKNAGKSTIIKFLDNSFNTYVTTGSMADFAKTNEFRSYGRQNGFVVNSWYKRLYLISELTESKQILNSQKIKGFVSGGLDQVAASLLRNDDAMYDIHFMISFFVNFPLVFDMPNDAALQSRRIPIVWFKEYKKPEDYTDPSSQMLANPEVEHWPEHKDRQLLFNHIILQSFLALKRKGFQFVLPPSIKQSAELVTDAGYTNKEKIDLLLQYVVISGNPANTIPMDTLKRICSESMGLPNTTKVLGQICDQMNALGVHFKTGVQARTSGAKRIQVCTGAFLRARVEGAQDHEAFTDFMSWERAITATGKVLDTNMMERLETIALLTNALAPQDDEFIRLYGSEKQLKFLSQHNREFRNIRQRTEP